MNREQIIRMAREAGVKDWWDSGNDNAAALLECLERFAALVAAAEQQECNHCGGTGDVSGEYPGVAGPECSGSGVQVKPEFFTHSVEQPYDWSDWVCPDPKSYLMKCCDCGLVHEAQFGVVRYKSETEREDCDMVDDPNLQAVFRMRRSEQWSPKDMAYRPGGLPLAEQPAQQWNAGVPPLYPEPEPGVSFEVAYEQPAQQQEPVAWMYVNKSTHETKFQKHMRDFVDHSLWSEVPLYGEPLANHELQCVCGAVWMGDEMVHLPDKRPPASKPWVGLSNDEIYDMYNEPRSDAEMVEFAHAIEAKLKEKNA